MKAELSKFNKYWIERHRYYELKHFCLQYPLWKKYQALSSNPKKASSLISVTPTKTGNRSDPTAEAAEVRAYYSDRIDLLHKVANEADPLYCKQILRGVTEGLSYDVMRARGEIHISRDDYYNLYRRFFWLLDKERR